MPRGRSRSTASADANPLARQLEAARPLSVEELESSLRGVVAVMLIEKAPDPHNQLPLSCVVCGAECAAYQGQIIDCGGKHYDFVCNGHYEALLLTYDEMRREEIEAAKKARAAPPAKPALELPPSTDEEMSPV